MKELGRIITLPKIFDPRGNLTVAEGETHIPFAIARTYWTYDVPGGESRGGHAHKECQEFIIAASGSFSVTLDNGEQKKTYHLIHLLGNVVHLIFRDTHLIHYLLYRTDVQLHSTFYTKALIGGFVAVYF